jgi:hypothetical protein
LLANPRCSDFTIPQRTKAAVAYDPDILERRLKFQGIALEQIYPIAHGMENRDE